MKNNAYITESNGPLIDKAPELDELVPQLPSIGPETDV